jgi:hypothetical protein
MDGRLLSAAIALIFAAFLALYASRIQPDFDLKVWSRSLRLSLESRLFIGLSADGMLESGCAISHGYGMPYIPGSSIKGAVTSYVCATDFGRAHPELKRQALEDIRSRWQAQDWWEEPPGRAARKANADWERWRAELVAETVAASRGR